MTQLSDDIVERMVALVRRMGDHFHQASHAADLAAFKSDDYMEARDIQNLLPAPVDPDVLAVLEIVNAWYNVDIADGYSDQYLSRAVAAYKRIKAGDAA